MVDFTLVGFYLDSAELVDFSLLLVQLLPQHSLLLYQVVCLSFRDPFLDTHDVIRMRDPVSPPWLSFDELSVCYGLRSRNIFIIFIIYSYFYLLQFTYYRPIYFIF